MEPNDYPPYYNSFLNYLKAERRFSDYTVRNYTSAIHNWLKVLNEENSQKNWSLLLSADLQQARSFVIEQQRYLSRKTIHNQVSALRTFYKYLIKHTITQTNPWAHVTLPKLEKKLPKFLTEKQVKRFLEGPLELLQSKAISPFKAWRDRLILEVLYGGGLRVSEAAALNYGHIESNQSAVRVLGKGNKERLCPLGTIAFDTLQYFKNNFAKDTSYAAPILLSDKYQRISVRAIQKITKEYLAYSSLPMDITPHKIRHSYATHMLNHGTDLRILQQLLGHSQLSTTQAYTHLDMTRLKEAHTLAHPRA